MEGDAHPDKHIQLRFAPLLQLFYLDLARVANVQVVDSRSPSVPAVRPHRHTHTQIRVNTPQGIEQLIWRHVPAVKVVPHVLGQHHHQVVDVGRFVGWHTWGNIRHLAQVSDVNIQNVVSPEL